MSKIKDIVDYLQSLYPQSLCSDFDKGKIGLQFGSMNAEVKKVIISLDSSFKVVDEALEKHCEMLISHHPFMFNPMLNLNYDSPTGKKMLKVFDNRLNIFAMHTNFDCGEPGMNDLLAKMMGLKNIYSLTEVPEAESLVRIGELETPLTLKEFALRIKDNLHEDHVRVVGDLNQPIKKVGIIGGGGASYTYQAMHYGIDCFISGEFRHNNGVDALEQGFNLIELSHYVEANFKPFLKELLEKKFSDVTFILSDSDTNPFVTL